MEYVFVYGTLKKGWRNHHLMNGADYIVSTITREPVWSMMDCPSWTHPGQRSPAVLDNGNYHIEGELYKITPTLLEKLDRLEQLDVHYKRRTVPLKKGESAWMYINILPDLPGIRESGHVQVDGDKKVLSWK